MLGKLVNSALVTLLLVIDRVINKPHNLLLYYIYYNAVATEVFHLVDPVLCVNALRSPLG